MGRSFTITLPYPPVTGNHATKHAKGRHYTTDRAREYQSQVLEVAARAALTNIRLPGPLGVEYIATPPDGKARDSDNVMKVLKDCLTRCGVWMDDSNNVIREERFAWHGVGHAAGALVRVRIYEL